MFPERGFVTKAIQNWNEKRKEEKETKQREKEIYDQAFAEVYEDARKEFLVRKAQEEARKIAEEKAKKKDHKTIAKVVGWLEKESKNWGPGSGEKSLGGEILSRFEEKPSKKGNKKESVSDVEI